MLFVEALFRLDVSALGERVLALGSDEHFDGGLKVPFGSCHALTVGVRDAGEAVDFFGDGGDLRILHARGDTTEARLDGYQLTD